MTPGPDINDTLLSEGEDAVRARSDRAKRYNGNASTLPYVNLTIDPIPPREWTVLDRVPGRNVTLLSGEGAVGKSILLLQLSAAISLGRDWIGSMPVNGPVMYFNCEDDDMEICRRLEPIAMHYGVTRTEIAAQLHVLSLVGRDATFGYADRTERIKTTPLFDHVRVDALKIRPRLIVLDTAADVFAGNENDRSQTRQFITLLRSLAVEAGAAIILASHPSLTGISSGTGLSGSTAWHNSVRARGYFRRPPDVDDPALRLLEWHKNNYGPVSGSILLRWHNGVYVPEPSAGSLEQLAADARIDNLFLDLLRRLAKQGRNVTDKTGPTFAPAVFADEPDAKKDKVSSKQFAEAMRRLFAANKIEVVSFGPPSRLRTRIVEVGAAQSRLRVVGSAPGAACIYCHSNEPPVLKIKNADVIGGKPEPLHERCAEAWFAAMQ